MTSECEHAWVPGGDWGPKHGHPWSSQDRYCLLCGLEGVESLGLDAPVIALGEPTYVFQHWKLAQRIPIRDEGGTE